MNRPGATQLIFVVAAVLIASVAPAQETVTRGERLAIDIAADGRIVMNLAGSVWILPGTGGEARLLDAGPGPVEHLSRERGFSEGHCAAARCLTLLSAPSPKVRALVGRETGRIRHLGHFGHLARERTGRAARVRLATDG